MQVTKLRISGDGLVPAGRYFAQVAENLCAAAEARYRKARRTPRTARPWHAAPM